MPSDEKIPEKVKEPWKWIAAKEDEFDGYYVLNCTGAAYYNEDNGCPAITIEPDRNKPPRYDVIVHIDGLDEFITASGLSSLHNAVAVAEDWLGKANAFYELVRKTKTPAPLTWTKEEQDKASTLLAARIFLSERDERTDNRINNQELYAGTPMYYWCRICGCISDVLPEEHVEKPNHVCSPCQELLNHGYDEVTKCFP